MHSSPALTRVDPVVGRLTESRLGKSDAGPPGALASWGGTPATPVCGPAWLARYAYETATWGEGDTLELGDVTDATGCEDHNGHALLTRAGFSPASVTYLPRAAAVVEAARGA